MASRDKVARKAVRFNHQTHHRGQVTTLLSQASIDPGVTDLLMIPEFQPAEPA